MKISININDGISRRWLKKKRAERRGSSREESKEKNV